MKKRGQLGIYTPFRISVYSEVSGRGYQAVNSS
jgi:hypothetical protein